MRTLSRNDGHDAHNWLSWEHATRLAWYHARRLPPLGGCTHEDYVQVGLLKLWQEAGDDEGVHVGSELANPILFHAMIDEVRRVVGRGSGALRKGAGVLTLSLDEGETLNPVSRLPGPEDFVDLIDLRDALNQLPKKRRERYLWHLQGYDAYQVGRATNNTHRSIWVGWHRAKKELQAVYAAWAEQERGGEEKAG